MTDAQMYFAIGVPVFAIIMAVVGGMFQFSALGARITSFETNINARFTGMENRFTSLESSMNSRFNGLESRFSSLEARFETLTGKVIEIDNRLTRVEALLERH